MPSGTEAAKQKMAEGIEKTRSAVGSESAPAGVTSSASAPSGGDNPKAGGSQIKNIATGGIAGSSYDPKKGPST
ncbi:hypothetical protein F4780DRAFT_782211 [Xylariomycetidae sp. FL0641]|nr:hypothetical protein F4780DRAFT_782211 [Xylariomycetidae sp. FL0641]